MNYGGPKNTDSDENQIDADYPEFPEDSAHLKSSKDLDKPAFRSATILPNVASSNPHFGTTNSYSLATNEDTFLGNLHISAPQKGKLTVEEKIVCPEKPFLVMKTHFTMEAADYAAFLQLVADINSKLHAVEGYDFSYVKQDVMVILKL